MENEGKWNELQWIKGYRFPSSKMVTTKGILEAMQYMPKDGDVILGGHPKTGTNWLKYTVFLIMTNGQKLESNFNLCGSLAPIMENVGPEVLDALQFPRMYKHTLPYHLLRKNANAKTVCIYRHPEDVLASLYYFYPQFVGSPIDFKEFFECFVNGNIPLGSYFDHVRSFYDHKTDPNLLLVSYEKLLADTKGEVLRIARFLGEQYIENLTKNENLLNKILELISFDCMKTLNFKLKISPDGLLGIAGVPEEEKIPIKYFRKGVSGDGKNLLSPDQIRRLKDVAFEKLEGTELLKEWY